MSSNKAHETFPIGLLLKGKKTLVAGGGKVAMRKASSLCAAGAEVLLVAPRIVDESKVNELGIGVELRVFRESDLDGVSLVFAATDDSQVNENILKTCQKNSVLCCVVDKGWSEGDFISPAVFRDSGMTFSVSSGGESCRRTRFYREYLERHLPKAKLPQPYVIGVSHKNLDLSERESLQLNPEMQKNIAQRLCQLRGLHEFTFLNTCNRIELYGLVHREGVFDELVAQMMGFSGSAKERCYIHTGFDAFSHACQVASGLHSQTPLENYIVSQLKEALNQALTNKWSSKALREWMDAALHISKKIRSVSRPHLQPQEIDQLALGYVNDQAGLNRQSRVVVMGTGLLGKKIAKTLNSRVCEIQWMFHKNKPDPLKESETAVNIRSLTEIQDVLPGACAVFIAVNSEKPVLRAEHSKYFAENRRTVVVDLGSPRTADPQLSENKNIDLVNLDDLKHGFRRQEETLNKVMGLAKDIIDEHRGIYERIFGLD